MQPPWEYMGQGWAGKGRGMWGIFRVVKSENQMGLQGEGP